MEEIIGLFMFYSWIHGTIICFKKLSGLTSYEKFVLWFGLIAFALVIIGLFTK